MLNFKLLNAKAELERVKEAVVAKQELLLKNNSEKMLEDLKDVTPVDTGFARNSWSLVKDSKDSVRVTNSAEYIEHLNRGSSKQAPALFIEKTALKYGKPIGAITKTTQS